MLERLSQIEAQLEALSAHAGIPYERPGSGLPPTVRDLVLPAKDTKAIQELYSLRGLSPVEARQVVDDL